MPQRKSQLIGFVMRVCFLEMVSRPLRAVARRCDASWVGSSALCLMYLRSDVTLLPTLLCLSSCIILSFSCCLYFFPPFLPFSLALSLPSLSVHLPLNAGTVRGLAHVPAAAKGSFVPAQRCGLKNRIVTPINFRLFSPRVNQRGPFCPNFLGIGGKKEKRKTLFAPSERNFRLPCAV